jgi:hypothetical protein
MKGTLHRRWANNPPCIFCGDFTHRIGYMPSPKQEGSVVKLRCIGCKRYFSERTSEKRIASLNRSKAQQFKKRAVEARKSQTLEGYYEKMGLTCPENEKGFMRRGALAAHLGISRQRVNQLEINRRLWVIDVDGIIWVKPPSDFEAIKGKTLKQKFFRNYPDKHPENTF